MTLHGTCPLCGVRKAKRECPALAKYICPVCCATKRLTEIACPDTCVYLTSARNHPAAVIQRRQERDLGFLLPLVSDLTEPQVTLFLFLRSTLLEHAMRAIPAVLDTDVGDAAAAVAATLETARKGVIYQHEPTSIPAQRLAAVFRDVLAKLNAEAGSRIAKLEADLVKVLRVIERGAKTAADALAGDEAPVFIGVLRRLPAPAAEAREGRSSETRGGGPLIVPG